MAPADNAHYVARVLAKIAPEVWDVSVWPPPAALTTYVTGKVDGADALRIITAVTTALTAVADERDYQAEIDEHVSVKQAALDRLAVPRVDGAQWDGDELVGVSIDGARFVRAPHLWESDGR